MKHGNKAQSRRLRRMAIIVIAIIVAAGITSGFVLHNRSSHPTGPLPVHLPTASGAYLGVYTKGFPASYDGVKTFSNATGANPDLVMYYSGWYVPFPAKFAETAAKNGAAPLIQMDPDNINVADIASGRYDAYLFSYAEAVKAYGHPVVMSFGHEMNGHWYSWSYQHTSPAVFVAAWKHVVTLFRTLGAQNVTWLWTVNIINDAHGGNIPSPGPWWPGSSYVNWVGIDGYYLKPSWQFAPLFGPTIAAVRALTGDPILIGETGAVLTAGQPAKITNLFNGVRDYGLLGFVWFDSTNNVNQDFSLSSPAALAAFRNGARMYTRPSS